MPQAMFTHFKSLLKESVMELTDRLSNLVERLHQRGVEYITDQNVVEKYLKSLDDSFDPIVAKIKEKPDYEDLQSAKIMELLVIHEELLEKEKGQSNSSSEEEGEILSDYDSSHNEDYENRHTITRDLEIPIECLNTLRRKNLSLPRSPEMTH
jgi:hypothetical protein